MYWPINRYIILYQYIKHLTNFGFTIYLNEIHIISFVSAIEISN